MSIDLSKSVGVLDIETNNLRATFGIVLSYCILEFKTTGKNGKIDIDKKARLYKNVIKPNEIKNGIYDRRLMKELIRDLQDFRHIITWNGKRFDIRFIRTRCEKWGLAFPEYGQLIHTDAILVCRNRFLMHSNRLEHASNFFDIPAKGHKLDPNVWLRALSGSKEALEFILTHNIEDVYSTARMYLRLMKYHAKTKTSI